MAQISIIFLDVDIFGIPYTPFIAIRLSFGGWCIAMSLVAFYSGNIENKNVCLGR